MTTKTIQQLEQELKEAKQNEIIVQQDKEITQLNTEYVGKCYGTSKFSQTSKGKYHNAVCIDSIGRVADSTYGTNRIILKYHFVRFSMFTNWKAPKDKDCQYSRGMYTTVCDVDNRDISNTVFDLVQRLKEIPRNTFDTLYSLGDECEVIIQDGFSGKIQMTIDKTMGDSSDQDRIIENHKMVGIDLIDLEQYPQLLDCIRYSTLPGLINRRFIYKDYADAALNLQIQLNHKRMNDLCSNRIYTSLQRENRIIEEHLQKIK